MPRCQATCGEAIWLFNLHKPLIHNNQTQYSKVSKPLCCTDGRVDSASSNPTTTVFNSISRHKTTTSYQRSTLTRTLASTTFSTIDSITGTLTYNPTPLIRALINKFLKAIETMLTIKQKPCRRPATPMSIVMVQLYQSDSTNSVTLPL